MSSQPASLDTLPPPTTGRPSLRQTVAECVAFVRRDKMSAATLDAIVAAAPRGDGTCVLVMPSLFRPDSQMRNLRGLLTRLGYLAQGWGLGPNWGPTPALMAGAMERLEHLAAQYGPVAVIGFSMGGLFARWLAHRATPSVQQVITVGSPIRDPLHSSCIPRAMLSAMWYGQDLAALAQNVGEDLPVPSTSLFSRRDGVVAWSSCCTQSTRHQNVEVDCHHVLMPQNPEVFRQIAAHLTRNRPPQG